MAIICTRIRQGLLWDKVRFRATEYHEVQLSSLAGDKLFYLNQGDEVVLRQPKSRMWETGDRVEHLGALVDSSTQLSFPWIWVSNDH